jgi:hypothetical protein
MRTIEETLLYLGQEYTLFQEQLELDKYNGNKYMETYHQGKLDAIRNIILTINGDVYERVEARQ